VSRPFSTSLSPAIRAPNERRQGARSLFVQVTFIIEVSRSTFADKQLASSTPPPDIRSTGYHARDSPT
jgi:hypothetical protein